MPKQHVGELVGHHAGHFRFRGRRLEHAAVDEHRPARQRERVDLFQIHRRERVLVDRVLEFGRGPCDEPVSEDRKIAGDACILDDRVLPADLGRGFAAELNVLFGRVLVLRDLDDRLRARHGPGGDHSHRQDQPASP
jgi:hypothetical protein